MVTGKRIRNILQKVDVTKIYSVEEAVKILKQNTTLKFDETLDVSVRLGVNPQHSDQIVRGVAALPHGTGKKVKIAVFAKGEKAKEAKEAGADVVGAEDLVDAILAGDVSCNKYIATPDMMALIGRIAKILGPKGLMPSAKIGSVTLNVKEAINLVRLGQVEFRVERAGIVHAGLGKLSFTEEALVENIKSFFEALLKAKPSGAKGVYFVKSTLSSTMGIGLKLDLVSVIKL